MDPVAGWCDVRWAGGQRGVLANECWQTAGLGIERGGGGGEAAGEAATNSCIAAAAA